MALYTSSPLPTFKKFQTPVPPVIILLNFLPKINTEVSLVQTVLQRSPYRREKGLLQPSFVTAHHLQNLELAHRQHSSQHMCKTREQIPAATNKSPPAGSSGCLTDPRYPQCLCQSSQMLCTEDFLWS